MMHADRNDVSSSNPTGDASMFKKTMIALFTAIVLSAPFASTANAQQCGHGDRELYSAYADFRGC